MARKTASVTISPDNDSLAPKWARKGQKSVRFRVAYFSFSQAIPSYFGLFQPFQRK